MCVFMYIYIYMYIYEVDSIQLKQIKNGKKSEAFFGGLDPALYLKHQVREGKHLWGTHIP